MLGAGYWIKIGHPERALLVTTHEAAISDHDTATKLGIPDRIYEQIHNADPADIDGIRSLGISAGLIRLRDDGRGTWRCQFAARGGTVREALLTIYQFSQTTRPPAGIWLHNIILKDEVDLDWYDFVEKVKADKDIMREASDIPASERIIRLIAENME